MDAEKCDKVPSVLLKNDVDLLKCINENIEFETDVLLENLNIPKDEDSDDDENYLPKDFIEGSYEKLWGQMSPVSCSTHIRKMVIKPGIEKEPVTDNSILRVHYVGYTENNNSFAFTCENEPEVINMKDEKHLVGFMMALKTMCLGETSRFLLSHNVMYGEQGCPPLIPPKAMCLFNISVLGVILPKACDKKTDEKLTTFQKVYEVARDLHVRGQFFFKKTEHNNAIKSFRHAVRLIENCRLADEVEEQKQQKFLAKLYTNLAICYNIMKMPLKTCCMCNNLAYMGKLWDNAKALLHNSRALVMLGEFKQAEKRIRVALALQPRCKEILDEIKNIEKKQKEAGSSRDVLERYMEFSFNLKESSCQANEPTSTRLISVGFETSMEIFCKEFIDNEHIYKLCLPIGLTKNESNIVVDIAKKHGLHCQYENDIVVSISKMEIRERFHIADDEIKH